MNPIEVEDIEYTPGLLARVYKPLGSGPHPAVVEVHGGGWWQFDRTQNAAMAEVLASNGIVVASLDFRMPPAVRYPEPIADVNAGIRWLKANAARFGSRHDLVGGLGASSGGHQLLLAALRPNDPRYSKLPVPGTMDASLAYLVGCWPVADPLARFKMVQERNNANLLKAHAMYFADEAAMAEGNPQRIVESREAKALPPLLVMQGTADDNLPADCARRLSEAWRAAGASATMLGYEGEPHTFITRNPASAASQAALEEIVTFIRKCGERAGKIGSVSR